MGQHIINAHREICDRKKVFALMAFVLMFFVTLQTK